MFRNSSFTGLLIWTICCVFAISLQTQVTILQSETYLGLRINLTDILAPVVAIPVLVSLLRRQSLWPRWSIPHLYLILATLSAVLSLSLLNTWLSFGEISQWALINKFTGWFILLTIFGIGGWIGTNATQSQISFFLKTLLYFFLAVLSIQTVFLILTSFETARTLLPAIGFTTYPLEGFMVNRNAYGLFFIGAITLATIFYLSDTPIIKGVYAQFFYFLTPLFVLLNGSRGVLITLCIVLPIILVFHRTQKKAISALLLALALGLSVTLALQHFKTNPLVFLDANTFNAIGALKSPGADQDAYMKPGDTMRVRIIADALEMIRQNPVLGSGLGSAMMYQEEKHGEVINLIDSTPLWLTVETGIAGALLFAVFYMLVFRTLFTSLKTDEGFFRSLREAILFILLGFTIMCLLHEIMYTRHMWFLIGLGLALPARMRQAV